MANNFVREAIDGGDLGVWAQYEREQNRRSLGKNSCRLYNDGGALKLSKGKIGIYNGSTYGTIIVDTVTTISLVGLTASRWAQVEVTFSGTAITVSILSIGAGSSYNALPVAFSGAYNGDKQGYYINATKRCIGLAWINAGGTLEGIINCLDDEGYYGQSQSDDANDYPAFFSFTKEDDIEFIRDVIGIRRLPTEIVVNEDGLDVDFRIESDTDVNAFFLRASDGFAGIGTSNPVTKLQVGGKVIDDASISYDTNSLMVVHQTPTATATLNDPKTALVLARQGTNLQTYGAGATFNLSRYENASTNSRTRLDISLAHGAFDITSNIIMTMLSNGNVGIGTSSPDAKMEIVGGDTITSLTDWNTKANSIFSLANPVVRIGIGYDAGDMPLIQGFDTTNTIRHIGLQVYGGNVGIGTTAMHQLLTVDGNISMYDSGTGNTDRSLYFASDSYIKWNDGIVNSYTFFGNNETLAEMTSISLQLGKDNSDFYIFFDIGGSAIFFDYSETQIDMGTALYCSYGRVVTDHWITTSTQTQEQIFEHYKALIPITGRKIIASGRYKDQLDAYSTVCAIERYSSTVIRIHNITDAGAFSYITITDGTATDIAHSLSIAI